MKNVIYQKPIVSSICVNVFFLLAWILIIKYNLPILLPIIGFITGWINREIFSNGVNLNKKNKCIFISLLVITMIIAFTYSFI